MDRDEVHQAAADLRDALNPPRIMMAVDVERTLSKAQRIVEMTSPSNGSGQYDTFQGKRAGVERWHTLRPT